MFFNVIEAVLFGPFDANRTPSFRYCFLRWPDWILFFVINYHSMNFFRVLHGHNLRGIQLSKWGLTSIGCGDIDDCQTLSDVFYLNCFLRNDSGIVKIPYNYRWIDLTFTDSKSNRERRKWKLAQKNLRAALVFQEHLFILGRLEITYLLLRPRPAAQTQI